MERREFISNSAKYAAVTFAGTGLNKSEVFASERIGQVQSISNHHSGSLPGVQAKYQTISTTVKLKGKDVKIHAISTGTVAIKTKFKSKSGIGELAKLNILLDKHYTEYLPIWVWVVEHPDGLVVIDTGEISAANQLDEYLAEESAVWRYFFKHSSKFAVDKKEELNYQFESINLKLDDVKLVVLTHLHLDHTDGLKFFPKQEIIVGSYEFKYAMANMPSTYPKWFNPNKVDYKKDRIEIFNEAYPITAKEDLLYIPTPGHTRGHSSVIFKTDDFDILFAGDTSYTQDQVTNGQLAGINADYKKSKHTYSQLAMYAALRPTIYLPSHDPEAGERLINRQFLG